MLFCIQVYANELHGVCVWRRYFVALLVLLVTLKYLHTLQTLSSLQHLHVHTAAFIQQCAAKSIKSGISIHKYESNSVVQSHSKANVMGVKHKCAILFKRLNFLIPRQKFQL
jgi:hypothetical protein